MSIKMSGNVICTCIVKRLRALAQYLLIHVETVTIKEGSYMMM